MREYRATVYYTEADLVGAIGTVGVATDPEAVWAFVEHYRMEYPGARITLTAQPREV